MTPETMTDKAMARGRNNAVNRTQPRDEARADMPANPPPIRANFGLLPEPKSSPASFVTSAAINTLILALAIYIGLTAKKVIETHRYEQTELIIPVEPPPQPKAALATAAAPAQVPQAKPSTQQVHLGETFGVTPNPNATKPATVAAIGNPYGGMEGKAVAPAGVVGSAGKGNGTQSRSNGGVQ